MDEQAFKKVIERYQQGLLSGDEKELLDKWFEQLALDKDSREWTKADKLKLKHKILSRIGEEKGSVFVGNFQQTFLSGGRLGTNFFRVAASVLLISTISYFLWQFSTVEGKKGVETLQVAASGKVSKVIFPDGSIVWLKGNSTLEYPKEFAQNARHVTLHGEALFEVSKDPARPFIIQCGELTTTVLGTTFNIKTGDKNIEVVVLTGKVSLTAEHDRQGVIVLPNEKALYWLDKRQIAKVERGVRREETTEVVAGTEYGMDFEDTPMAEVIERIEGKFNVSVYIRDPRLGKCMITADFTGQSLERTLDMIAQVLGFEYEITDKKVMLSGEGCD